MSRLALLALLLAAPAIAQMNAAERVRANVTSSSTTPAVVSGLSWPVAANALQAFFCVVTHQGTATSGPRFNVSGPASPTRVNIRWQRATTATAQTQSSDTAFSANAQTAAITSSGNTGVLTSFVYGTLVNGSNAGTVALNLSSSTAGQTVTVFAGSACLGY